MLRLLWITCALALPLPAAGARLILNEVNAVDSAGWLAGGTAAADQAGGLAADPVLGRIPGNGGDWFELVVVADGLDARGFTFDLYERGVHRVQLALTGHPLWANLAAGTIVTIAESIPEDPSYDPASGDFWIHVQAAATGSGLYVSALDFPTSNEDWQVVIRDASGGLVFGPAGEGTVPGITVNSRELLRLEADPSALIHPASPSYSDSPTSSFGAPNRYGADTQVQDFSALRQGLPGPDRDGDGVADDGDRSGVAGDAPCATNASAGCDDNCPLWPNPGQADTAGLATSGPDGRGDACQCGDVNDDAAVTQTDASLLRTWLAQPVNPLPAPAKCGVVSDGGCTVADLAVLARIGSGLGPDPAPVCLAARGPATTTDAYYARDRVLDVDVTMAPADWETLRNQSRYLWTYLSAPTCGDAPFPSPYTWFPATVRVDGVTVELAGIRKKGLVGSASKTKPALKLDFGHFVAGRDLNGLSSMTLNNARQDPSYVKQCVAALMLADAGVPVGRCNFARVRVNGVELGLYVHVEEYRAPFLARSFGSASGKLYEGTASDFVLGDWRGTFESKNGVAANAVELDALVAALELPDAELAPAVAALVDLPAFANFWAAGALVGDWDGYVGNQNNFWLYLHPGTGRFHFLPWGLDDVLGRGNPAFYEDAVNAPPIVARAALARRLYGLPETQEASLERLVLLADRWDAERYLAEVARIEALITPITGDLSAALAPVRAWIAGRRAVVEAALANGIPPWNEGPRDHPCLY